MLLFIICGWTFLPVDEQIIFPLQYNDNIQNIVKI